MLSFIFSPERKCNYLAAGLWLSPITTHNILEGLVFFCDLAKNKSILREKWTSKYFKELCEPTPQ